MLMETAPATSKCCDRSGTRQSSTRSEGWHASPDAKAGRLPSGSEQNGPIVDETIVNSSGHRDLPQHPRGIQLCRATLRLCPADGMCAAMRLVRQRIYVFRWNRDDH